jgi:hypothetical protein
LITHDAPQSVGLLWTSDQSVAETSTPQHSQQTNTHAPRGIRTHNLSRRAAEDLRLRLRGHWDRQLISHSTLKKTHHHLYATNEEVSHSYQFQVPVEYVLSVSECPIQQGIF